MEFSLKKTSENFQLPDVEEVTYYGSTEETPNRFFLHYISNSTSNDVELKTIHNGSKLTILLPKYTNPFLNNSVIRPLENGDELDIRIDCSNQDSCPLGCIHEETLRMPKYIPNCYYPKEGNFINLQ